MGSALAVAVVVVGTPCTFPVLAHDPRGTGKIVDGAQRLNAQVFRS